MYPISRKTLRRWRQLLRMHRNPRYRPNLKTPTLPRGSERHYRAFLSTYLTR